MRKNLIKYPANEGKKESMVKFDIRAIILSGILSFSLSASSCLFLKITKLEIPDARWEKLFFREIDSITKLSALKPLRETQLAGDDIELRIWRGFSTAPSEGVILKRTSDRWSAAYVKADTASKPTRAEIRELGEPKSGWDPFWKSIVSEGVLTLPDSSAINCFPADMDAISYVVEINKDNIYRTYMYQAQNAKCPEAQQMKKIGRIIAEEFYDGVGECKTSEWLPCVAKFGVQNDL